VDPVPDPLPLRKSGSAGNRTRVLGTTLSCTGFEVVTEMIMKSIIFWSITRCSPLEVKRRFGGTFRFHLHGGRIIPSKKAASKQVASREFYSGFLLGLFLDSEAGGDIFLRNVACVSTDYTALYPRR
jgi:hypothetical protein